MIDRERFKVYGGFLDQTTINALNRLYGKYFDALLGPISTGKEADVLKAEMHDKFIAVKIYRFRATTFDNISDYIIGDPRFENVRKNKRSIIFTWTKKEYSNLLRMQKAGVRVPEPIAFKDNILLMEFIGSKEGVPALTAKQNPPSNPEKWKDKIYAWVKDLYEKQKMIHADLSEYNILNHNGNPVIIDVGQAVLKEHPKSMVFLKHDVLTITKWFNKLGVKDDSLVEWYDKL